MALTVTPTDEMKTLKVGEKIYEIVDDEARTDLNEVKADFSQLDSDVDILREMATGDLTWAQIQRIVQAGNAEKWFSIGDQLEVEWTDTNGTTHTLPFDVVSFAPVVKEGENTESPGMWLESHYAMEPVQFDQNEAFYVLSDALPAGTYHFTFGTTWGSKDVVSGDSYSFTTTRAYPAGAQFVIGSATSDASSLPDTLSSTWRIRTYENPSDTVPAEILPLTAGASGVSLGIITSDIKYADSGLNNLQRAGYGYNRWAMSAMRQWLNSGADVGAWWTPSNPFDRAPAQLGTYKGFMTGFDADFLAAISPVKVTTALNTVSDSTIGTTEDTYDTFFLASLEQEYIVPQLAGAEGAYWPYWKERLGLDSPQVTGTAGTNAAHIRYVYNARTSAQFCRLRSAIRGTATYPWHVTTTGSADGNNAAYAYRGCPACVIA